MKGGTYFRQTRNNEFMTPSSLAVGGTVDAFIDLTLGPCRLATGRSGTTNLQWRGARAAPWVVVTPNEESSIPASTTELHVWWCRAELHYESLGGVCSIAGTSAERFR